MGVSQLKNHSQNIYYPVISMILGLQNAPHLVTENTSFLLHPGGTLIAPPISQGTPPKFNISPEKWWLEDYFPIGKVTFQGLC